MSDNVFLDSNILVYSYSSSEISKQKIARKVIEENNSFISTQVLQELCNIVTLKFKFTYTQAVISLQECSQNNNLHVNDEKTIFLACNLAERYAFSFYDSLIIAAALENNCTTLYSEDMQTDK
ncbi:PIN domain-containing protein [Dyadobacter frigoris]|uniref:PIN domain-containing protein n=1 Tax=Dyadobacter frigoris TaxID=2576211 RepID=A0A4U6D3W2_9BACT|nr:PIN domain-containing protein [Dyadobacter frigoris]TKT90887.1 PIN domain-containing protein [Dyadobacter frigoris]GLU56749.1 twitching motility protein PilT [Dyadobacter frigoris]